MLDNPLILASPVMTWVDKQGDTRAKARIRDRIGRAVRDPYIMRR